MCEKYLGLEQDKYELFALVPLTEQHLTPEVFQRIQNQEIAIRITESSNPKIIYHVYLDFSMKTVEDTIADRDKYRNILEKTNEALLTYVEEMKKIKRFLADACANAPGTGNGADLDADEINKDSILRKAMKSK